MQVGKRNVWKKVGTVKLIIIQYATTCKGFKEVVAIKKAYVYIKNHTGTSPEMTTTYTSGNNDYTI